LAAVFAAHAAAAPTPSEGAEALAAWANAQGGRDNVTVVLVRITR
jgi:serine/threonine protein phosphatase PrpC